MSLKLILRSNWARNIFFSITFMIVLSGIYSLMSTGYVCPVISRVDDITIVNRCTSDFGPRSSTSFHNGVDISRASGVEGDKIRNIHEEAVTILEVIAYDPERGNYIKTRKTGTPNIYVRYMHMRNNYPNESDANRWVFLNDAQLGDGSTADIIVQYQNGSISKVWGAVTNKTYQGVPVSTTLTSSEIFGRVGNTGSSTAPHLHIDINNEDSSATTHAPFGYIPRGSGYNTNLTLVSPVPGTLQRNTMYTFTYTVDSLSDTQDTDLDFECATLDISPNGGQSWTFIDSFRVQNLERSNPSSGKFKEKGTQTFRMKSNSLGSDEIYLYWTPTSAGNYKVRCSIFHAKGGAAFATVIGDYNVS